MFAPPNGVGGTSTTDTTSGPNKTWPTWWKPAVCEVEHHRLSGPNPWSRVLRSIDGDAELSGSSNSLCGSKSTWAISPGLLTTGIATSDAEGSLD